MIGKLTGIIDSFGDNNVLLDVGGVGYLIFASSRTLARIGKRGDPASLLIDTHVREDHIHLYGFADRAEQQWFRILTGVQGVGAKVGLALLSACPADQIALAIAAQDKSVLTAADGVGPKLAARILTELKDKAAALVMAGPSKADAQGGGPANPVSMPGLDGDAISALVNLGYGRADAYKAVMQAMPRANDNLQILIREALKELSA